MCSSDWVFVNIGRFGKIFIFCAEDCFCDAVKVNIDQAFVNVFSGDWAIMRADDANSRMVRAILKGGYGLSVAKGEVLRGHVHDTAMRASDMPDPELADVRPGRTADVSTLLADIGGYDDEAEP